MQVKKVEPARALDRIVCEFVNKFERILPHCVAHEFYDPATGDQFIVVNNKHSNEHLTVWVSGSARKNPVMDLINQFFNSETSQG